MDKSSRTYSTFACWPFETHLSFSSYVWKQRYLFFIPLDLEGAIAAYKYGKIKQRDEKVINIFYIDIYTKRVRQDFLDIQYVARESSKNYDR